jgi:hypothetical protein
MTPQTLVGGLNEEWMPFRADYHAFGSGVGDTYNHVRLKQQIV